MPLGRKNQPDNIKRASYYVCFIGAKESPVVRDHDYGREFVYPATEYLLRSVVEAGPISNAPKITLQVSGKGLKIMQNVSRSGLVQSRISAGKTDTLRHFIPHHCITCAYQGPPPYDDLVATILLIYNPVTRCPVHIHVYRCDSNHTAAFLTQQLVIMSQRPENQMKFAEIEAKLSGRGLLNPVSRNPQEPRGNPIGSEKLQHLSDDQSSGRTSSSPGTSESGGGGAKLDIGRSRSVTSSNGKSQDHASTPQPTSPITQQVTKLTAEFQQRLKTRDSAPILLPPKDYDTVNRSRGKTGLSLVKSEEKPASSSRSTKSSSSVLVDERINFPERSVDAGVQTSGRGGVPEDFFDSSKTSRLVHRSTENILPSRRKAASKKSKKRVESDDEDDWQVDEREEDEEILTDHEEPIITKLTDFDKDLFQERLKRYSSLSDVFGDTNDPIVELVSSKAPILGTPPPVTPSSSDASAAYRPRPYYFTAEEAEREEKETRKMESNRRRETEEVRRNMEEEQRRVVAEKEHEQMTLIQSRNVRPNLPVKRNQRPVVSERVRPASFYERIRFDDRDFQEGKFVRPEMVYYQYRS